MHFHIRFVTRCKTKLECFPFTHRVILHRLRLPSSVTQLGYVNGENTSVKAFFLLCGMRVFLCFWIPERRGEWRSASPASGEVGRELTLTLVIGQQAVHVMSYPGRVLKHVHCLSFPWSVQVSLNVAFLIVGQQQVQEVLVEVILIEHLLPTMAGRVEALPFQEFAIKVVMVVVIVVKVVLVSSTESREDERGQPSSQGRMNGC